MMARALALALAGLLAAGPALGDTEIVRQPGESNAVRISQPDGLGFVARVLQPGAGNVARVYQGPEPRSAEIAFDPPPLTGDAPESCDVVTGSPCRAQVAVSGGAVRVGDRSGVFVEAPELDSALIEGTSPAGRTAARAPVFLAPSASAGARADAFVY